jgi:hypothetical protein
MYVDYLIVFRAGLHRNEEGAGPNRRACGHGTMAGLACQAIALPLPPPDGPQGTRNT